MDTNELLLELRADVKLLLSYVVGNGTPGLVRRVSEIENRQAKLEAKESVISNGAKIVIGLLTASGTVVGIVIDKLLR